MMSMPSRPEDDSGPMDDPDFIEWYRGGCQVEKVKQPASKDKRKKRKEQRKARKRNRR